MDFFTSIIIVIVITILILWLLSRNTKEHKSVEDFPNDAHAQIKQLEKETRNKWWGIATSHLSESDDEYALISNKENVFKLPKTQDYSSYEEPLINNERLKKFTEWAKNKKSYMGSSNLFDLIDSGYKSKYPTILEVEVPHLLSANFYLIYKTGGAYFCEDFNAYGFEINRFKTTETIALNAEDCVKVLTNPNLFDWLDYIDNLDNFSEDMAYGDFSYFLKDSTEFIPKTGEAYDYFDSLPLGEESILLYCELISKISYKDEIFRINDEEFTFLKKEKDHLITLLMASYKPSLLRAIMEEIDNKIS